MPSKLNGRKTMSLRIEPETITINNSRMKKQFYTKIIRI